MQRYMNVNCILSMIWGVIRDELEFRRDIENAGDAIKVVIVKH